MNTINNFWLCSVVWIVLMLSDHEVLSQHPEWKLIPPINDSVARLSRESKMDFDNFELLNEMFNAIDVLSANTFFLSEEQLAEIHSIKMQLDEALFLEASARQRGVELDLDVIFAMRTSKASGLLLSTSEVLGDKIDAVIHVVNRRRIGDWSGALPPITGERMAELLNLGGEQQALLAELAEQYEAGKKDASKTLAEDLRKLRDEYRTKMLHSLDAEGRRWFNSTFGEPIDLLDENGRSVFFELIEKYDFAPTNNVLETVRSFVAEPVSPQHAEHDRVDPSARLNAPEKVVIDAIEYALIRSELIQQQLGLSESQSKAIRETLAGKSVELTNETRDSRLMELMAGNAINRSEMLKSLSTSQGNRLDQIEIQVRTSGNLDSFGILDDLVALHLRLDAEVRREVAQFAQEYTDAVAQLLEKHRVESQRLLLGYQRGAFAVLTDAQKRDFESFFGTFEVR